MGIRRITALLFLLLAGCADAPVAPAPAELFLDERFAPSTERINAEDVFALSDAMKRYLEGEIARHVRAKGPQRALIDALYDRRLLKLEYDSAITRNAAEAFEARSGNCLSLVIMTAAFAKALGLEVYYRSAVIDELWSRSGGVYFLNGHVNLTLGQRLDHRSQLLTIDFLPAEFTRGLRTRDIDEETIVAMYMNNRAAESLARGRMDDAYWWLREAIRQNPAYLSAYNTLGVVYLRHGSLLMAEQVLKHVLEREPQNTRALANLALVFEKQGRAADSAPLYRKLAQIEGDAPFHFLNLGMAAMEAGDFKSARDYFAREIERSPYYHEFHFWLGIAYLRLGDIRSAQRQLALAREYSTTRRDHDLYAAKLHRLGGETQPH